MSVLEALDDGIAALTYLRLQAAQGRVDEAALEALLRSGLLDHDVITAALAALKQADQESAESSGEDAPAGDADGGEESEESEPESPHREAEELVARFAGLPAALAKLGVPVPEQANAFCKGVGRVVQGLPDDEQKGEALGALLFKGMGVLDHIQHELLWSGHREPLQSTLDSLRVPMAALLERDNSLTFVPPVGLHSIDPDAPPGDVTIEWVPSSLPAGTALAVVSRAYCKDGTEGGKAKLIVARGTPGEMRGRLLDVWQAVESDGASDPTADLAKLSRWIGELDDEDEVSQMSTARHVLNLVHDRNNSGVHNALEKALIAFLGKSGITVISARVGKRFDDSFKPSKFDRQLEYSDQPEGTIVRIVRIGLLDSGGIPLQKTVLGVSRGT